MTTKQALRLYSDILILRDSTYRALKSSPGAPLFIALMFLTVTLLAGCGKWLGLPYELSRPTLAEEITRLSQSVDDAGREVVPDVQETLDSLSSDNLSFTLGEVLPPQEPVTAEALAEVAQQSGLTMRQLIALVERRADVPDADAEALAAQPPTVTAVNRLLAAAALTPDEVREVLATERLVAVPQEITGDGGFLNSLVGGFFSGVTANEWLQQAVADFALTPSRLRGIVVRLGLEPATVATLNERIAALPEQAQSVLAIAEEEAELLEPPLGITASRLLAFVGDWLATPFQIAATYLPLVLVSMLAATALGGRGTVTQHIFGTMLAAAPALLLAVAMAGNLGPGVPKALQYAIGLAGRILGLIAIAWAFIILVKALAVVHGFSAWRAVGTVALSFALIYVIAPLVLFLVSGYLLRG